MNLERLYLLSQVVKILVEILSPKHALAAASAGFISKNSYMS